MRILLDECLPRRLKRLLVGHQSTTVGEMGWAGTRNGELLTRAHVEFDVFLTVDRRIPSQQNLRPYDIAVVLLIAPSNSLKHLQPLIPRLLAMLAFVRPGEALTIGPE